MDALSIFLATIASAESREGSCVPLELTAMEPRAKPTSKGRPKPLPVGLVRQSDAAEIGSADAREGAPAPPPPKKSVPWHKTRRGRRDLLRAIQNRHAQQQEAFYKLDKHPRPFDRKMQGHEYPSEAFLNGAENYMLARYANFLLQCILQLIRVFKVDPETKNTYGEGFMTSARCALLFMRCRYMDGQAAQRLGSVKRHLYARMRSEQESAEAVKAVTEAEWRGDRTSALTERCHEWVVNFVPGKITSGMYPLTNLEYDMAKQWDDVWTVFGENKSSRKLLNIGVP